MATWTHLNPRGRVGGAWAAAVYTGASSKRWSGQIATSRRRSRASQRVLPSRSAPARAPAPLASTCLSVCVLPCMILPAQSRANALPPPRICPSPSLRKSGRYSRKSLSSFHAQLDPKLTPGRRKSLVRVQMREVQLTPMAPMEVSQPSEVFDPAKANQGGNMDDSFTGTAQLSGPARPVFHT